MLTKRGLRGAFLVTVFVGTSMVAQAGWVNRINIFKKWQSRNRVDTLVITGNYGRSRLLAALAQNKRKHPILLISPEEGGQEELFFMPSRPEAEPIPQAEFLNFVGFLKPRRIIILGDSSYVPTQYVDELRRNRFSTIVLNSEDWGKNAESLAGIIDYKRLPKHYAGYVSKLELAKSGAVASDARAAPAPRPAPMGELMAPITTGQ